MVGVILSIGIAGCAATGDQFGDFSQPAKNEGILYVYRPSNFRRGGVKYTVYDVTNNKVIGTLRNGGYIRYETKPGKIVISMISDSQDGFASVEIALIFLQRHRGLTRNLDITGEADKHYNDMAFFVHSITVRKNDIACIRWDAVGDQGVPNGPVDKSTCRKEIAKTKLSYK